jgi:competence protein ComEC
MALLVILARVTGRQYNVTRALFMAGGLMVIHNPKILAFDVSFQLSFMATLGLIYLSPKIIEYLKFLPSKFQIRELMAATIATQLFVLPILLFKVGNLSIISPIANLIVLPFIPLTMLFGFFTSLVGLISSLISLPLATISYFLLHFQITIVQLLSGLPFSSVSIETFPLWGLLLVYFIYILVMKKLT